MKKFAFICHPLDFQHLASVDQGILKKSPRLVRQMMAQLPPNHVRTIEIVSPNGERAIGEMINVWLLPDQFHTLDRRLILHKLQEAFEIAKNLKCSLVGLGAYTKCAVYRRSSDPQIYPFALTTGNTLTAALAVEALVTIIRERDWLRENLEITIVGANGSIGNAVCRVMAPHVSRLNLVGRNETALKDLAQSLRGYGCHVQSHRDAKFACRDSPLIFMATSEPGLLIQARDLPLNTCVVDISKPANILSDPERPDVKIIDCGMVKTPLRKTLKNIVQCFPYVEGLDSAKVFACFAETMILALEGCVENYSASRKLDIEKFEDMLDLATKHHFFSSREEECWNTELPSESKTFPRKYGIAL